MSSNTGLSRLLRKYLLLCPLSFCYQLGISSSTADYTAIPRLMPTNRKAVRPSVFEKYTSSRDALRTALAKAPAAVHITFEPWTSPGQRSFLAIFGHFVGLASGDHSNILLGFRRLQSPHSGENQVDCTWQVAMELGITRKLGYFTTDNSSLTDNMMQCIAEK